MQTSTPNASVMDQCNFCSMSDNDFGELEEDISYRHNFLFGNYYTPTNSEKVKTKKGGRKRKRPPDSCDNEILDDVDGDYTEKYSTNDMFAEVADKKSSKGKQKTKLTSLKNTMTDDDHGDYAQKYFTDDQFIELDVYKINKILKDLHEKAEEYVEGFKYVNIKIDWELPEAHKSPWGIMHKYEHRSVLTKKGTAVLGPMKADETKYVCERLKQFCDEYEFDFQVLKMCLKNNLIIHKMLKNVGLNFLLYLSKDLKNRLLVTVYSSFNNLDRRKGSFSSGETQLMRVVYEKCSHMRQALSLCSTLLNRSRATIRKKYQRLKIVSLQNEPEPKKLARTQLRNNVLERIKKRIKTSLNGNVLIRHKSWIAIGKECGISPAAAKAIYFCELKASLSDNHPILFYKYFLELFDRIYNSDWEDWETVDWTKLSREFHNTGPVFLYAMLRNVIMKYVPQKNWENFRDCASYLYLNVRDIFEKKSESEELIMNQFQLKA